jgi:hypothetical protein
VYYLHVQPGNSFIGGGMFHPPAEPLARIRASIDERPWRWRRALNDPAFRRTFLEGAKPGEEGAVAAFVKRNRESALKTKPKVSECRVSSVGCSENRTVTYGKTGIQRRPPRYRAAEAEELHGAEEGG